MSVYTMLDSEATKLAEEFGLGGRSLEPGSLNAKAWNRAVEVSKQLTLTELIISDTNPSATDDLYTALRQQLGDIKSQQERQERLAAAVLYLRVQMLCDDKPAFQHDCNNCTYLFRMARAETPVLAGGVHFGNPDHRLVDIYACHAHGKAYAYVRYSNDPGGLLSHDLDAEEAPTDPHLIEAAQRANNLV